MTKLKSFFMLSVLLGGSLLNTQPTAAQTPGSPPALFCALGTDKDRVRHKSGPEVANRVKEMQRTNRNVRRALEAFERNEKKTNRRPRIDDATSVTFDIEKKSGAVALFRKASFTQGSLVPAGSIEIISIPTYSAPGEWQGTILAYEYDAAGYFVDEYIADVILLPDPTYTYWDAILEVSYDWEGTWLEHGTEALYDQLGTQVGGWPATSGSLVGLLKNSKPQFQKAQFQPGRAALAKRIVQNARFRRYVRCVWTGAGVAAAGCGIVSAFFAGAPFIPCFLGTSTGANAYCLIT